jgi:hypothetical protein
MKIGSIGIVAALAVSLGTTPAMADPDRKDKKEKKEKHDKQAKRDHRDDRYFHRHGYERLSIPKGHYPPPGMCRAWYPDKPPGHQPAPQRCGATVPQGAWLIEHPQGARGRVKVTAYAWQGYVPPPPPPRPVVQREVVPPPGAVVYRQPVARAVWSPPPVLAVGEFNVADGVLVRVVVQ